MEDVRSDCLKQRSHALKGVLIAAAKYSQRACLRAGHTSGHRRVDVAHAGGSLQLCQALYDRD